MKDLFLRHGYEWKLEPEAFWKVMEPFVTHLAEHAAEWWLAEDRVDGKLAGYARSVERDGLFELSELFVRPDKQGPIVVLEPDDQPAILLHFETLAQSRGMESISFQVPSINVVVMHHLLERGYKIDTPPGLLMSSKDFGRFDCFVPFAPAIVL